MPPRWPLRSIPGGEDTVPRLEQKSLPTQVNYTTLNSKLLDAGSPGKCQKNHRATLLFPILAKMMCIQLTPRTGRGDSDNPATLPASWGTAMPCPDVCRRLPTSVPRLPTLQKLLGLLCSSAQILDW